MEEYGMKIAQGGFAAGRVFCITPDEDSGRAAAFSVTGTPEEELFRFNEAVRVLGAELQAAAASADKNSSAIYEAEKTMLEDDWYAGTVRSRIGEEGLDALSAVEKTGADLIRKIEESGNEYIRQRSDDVRGVTQRLLSILKGEEARTLSAPSILVAEELSPAQLSGMDSSLILGIITVKGAPSSHVSILAGNLGIPYVYGSPEAVAAACACDRLILDNGKLILDPEEDVFQEALRRQEAQMRPVESSPEDHEKRRTRVCANIAGPEDLEALLASRAEGVGLFRSEFLFLAHDRAPSEEEQFEAYRDIAKAMGEKETVIRTMDLGADKSPDWLSLPSEKNPSLGCRGLRVSLRERVLFKTQLRALLRAAVFGNVKIMVPMVTSVWEVEAVRTCLEECAKELAEAGTSYRMPPLGIMVETPAAALIAQQLAEKVDFFSIGTNDLTQYTLALDREATGLEDYYAPCHDAVFRLIAMTADAGHRTHISTSVCGELAGNPLAIKKLIEAGVDKLSVSLPRIEATIHHVLDAEKELMNEQIQSKTESAIAAPVDGSLVPMEEIPDRVFSSGTMGECIGILPENGSIYAPCDGIVSGVAGTKHALTFTSSDGREILVHVGIDTVSLKGKGFTLFVKQGTMVSKGDKVMDVDLSVIHEAGLSPMVITALIPALEGQD